MLSVFWVGPQGEYVSCLLSLLRQMCDTHYQHLLDNFQSKDELKVGRKALAGLPTEKGRMWLRLPRGFPLPGPAQVTRAAEGVGFTGPTSQRSVWLPEAESRQCSHAARPWWHWQVLPD